MKFVVEVKAPVNNRADGTELPYKRNRKNREDDYEKTQAITINLTKIFS